MSCTPVRISRFLVVIIGLFALASVWAQREREIQPPETPRYGTRFFVQLRGVFGRFRDTDLQRVFEAAQPIECSELVNDKGEWRTVAFFNEKRELGDWYRSSFDEVKSDLSVFVFKGVCRGKRGPVQLTTKFPVRESIEAYNQRRIGLDEVEVNVNAPVSAAFDSQTQAYTFDLPYLFLISEEGNESIYSLEPPRLADRGKYATEVTNHWDCKSVTAQQVTYQFLICRTTTAARNSPQRRQNQTAAFGASAYFILSDGNEASSSVKLSFTDASDARHPVQDASGSNPPDASGGRSADAQSPAAWEVPDPEEKILDLERDEFRIRFDIPTWTGKIAAAQVLYQHELSSLESSKPGVGRDYCVWLPGASSSANYLLAKDPDVEYSITAHDQDGQSSTSIVFDIGTAAGLHAGKLQCVFPRTASAASIAFDRWTSIVGRYLTLEVRP